MLFPKLYREMQVLSPELPLVRHAHRRPAALHQDRRILTDTPTAAASVPQDWHILMDMAVIRLLDILNKAHQCLRTGTYSWTRR